ncbi:MAG TPA: hypothetical protein VE981_22315 [Planctomycetota bacterium]|nr:hypothetical protein [Planctomycetota bacterium]
MVEGSPPPRAVLPPFVRFLPAGVYIGLPAILIFTALAPGQFLYGLDTVGAFYHLRALVGEELASGRLPVWDSHIKCGAPLLAGMHAGVLYPPTWLSAVVAPGLFWTLTAWLHLSLSGFFADAWLRRGLGLSRLSAFAGGLVYMLSGFMVTRIFAGHIPNISGYPWAAALMWRLERHLGAPTPSRGLLLGIPLALMIFAGLPHFVMIAGLALLARLLHFVFETREGRRGRALRAGGAAGWLALGALMAAPQLLPTLELLRHIQRTSINSYDFVTSYSLPPENLLTFLLPTLLGDDRVAPYWGRWNLWELCGFVGLSGLALAALGVSGARRQRFLWAGAALAGILLALGSHSPVFRIFHLLIPGAGLFRVPARYLLLTTLALVPLVGMGVERLLSAEDRRSALRVAAAALVLLVVVGAAGVYTRSPERWSAILERQQTIDADSRDQPFPAGDAFREASRSLATRGILWAAASLAILSGSLAAFGRVRPDRSWCAGLLVLLLGTELIAFSQRYFIGYPEAGMAWPPEFVASVRAHPAFPFRIATVNAAQLDVFGRCELAKLDAVGGFDPMMLRTYTELTNIARGEPIDGLTLAMHAARPGPVFDLLGARYWLLPILEDLPTGWRVAGRLESGYIYENPGALPRAFLVGRSVVLPSAAARLEFLGSKTFRPDSVVVLESGQPETFPDAEGRLQGARILERDSGRYAIEVNPGAPSFLVLTESFYPGWKAEIDGVPAELLRADHLVQAVRVPSGRHRVVFTYRSTLLPLGMAIGILALGIPLGLHLYRRKRGSPGT